MPEIYGWYGLNFLEISCGELEDSSEKVIEKTDEIFNLEERDITDEVLLKDQLSAELKRKTMQDEPIFFKCVKVKRKTKNESISSTL